LTYAKEYVMINREVRSMKTIPITKARKDIYNLVDETINTSEPIQITGKRGNVILLSEADWNAMQETLYLLSIPGMKESILEGDNTPIDECLELEDIGWDIE